jgi:hypothetical protein
MNRAPKDLLFLLTCGCLLAGCGTGPVGETPSVNVAKSPSPKICPVHHLPLVKVAGYFPSDGTMADPTWDYVRFMSANEAKYPFARPWSLAAAPEKGWSKKSVEPDCPECDKRFKADLAAYEKLSESAKEARFEASLERQVAREKKTGHRESPWGSF